MSAVLPRVEPRTVPVERGSAWLGEGFELFRKTPGTWIGITLAWGVISVALSAVPGAGELVSAFLNPIFQAGILLGCASLAQGQGLRFEHLFAGFRSGQLGPLLMLTVVLLLFFLGAALVGVLTVLGTVKSVILGEEDPLRQLDVLSVLLAVLVVLALTLPIVMLAWFAPALIIFRKLPPWAAMKLSFRACTRNLLPFLLYGLIGLVLLVVACIPVFLGLLVVIPVLQASIYASYREIFPD